MKKSEPNHILRKFTKLVNFIFYRTFLLYLNLLKIIIYYVKFSLIYSYSPVIEIKDFYNIKNIKQRYFFVNSCKKGLSPGTVKVMRFDLV